MQPPGSFHKIFLAARLAIAGGSLLLAVACTSAPPAQPFSAGQGDLTVELLSLRNRQGQLLVSLFATEEGFPDQMGRALRNRTLVITDERAQLVFQDLPYGAYAISVLHDENRDSQMESSWLGQPQEGFGFSGQPDYTFGPPDFAAARFLLLAPERSLTIKLRYETSRREKRELARPKGAGIN